MSILITGVNGFIGSHVLRAFQERGDDLAGIDIHDRPHAALPEYRGLTLPSSDIGALVRRWNPRICIHCAGPASVANSVQNPAADFQGSVGGTQSLLEALRHQAPECRLVYLSSAAVYGNPVSLPIFETSPIQPISPYGFHKQMCEALCLEYTRVFGLRTAAVRIFSAYGPGLRRQVVADICSKLAAPASAPLELHGTGEETRDFIHVEDIVRGLVSVLDHGRFEGEVYNLASGSSASIRQVAEILGRRLNPAREIRFNGVQRVGDPLYWSANIDKLGATGFTPSVDLAAGLSAYAEWFTSTSAQSAAPVLA